jgi:hypothetical protein
MSRVVHTAVEFSFVRECSVTAAASSPRLVGCSNWTVEGRASRARSRRTFLMGFARGDESTSAIVGNSTCIHCRLVLIVDRLRTGGRGAWSCAVWALPWFGRCGRYVVVQVNRREASASCLGGEEG